MTEPRKDIIGILSLSDVAERIRSALQKNMPDGFWVKTEIHKLNLYPQSGHCYPDLVEKESGKVKAQMRATIWAGDFQRIDSKFKRIAHIPLGDNLVVLFYARIQFHPVFGLSLNILDIDPTYTLGVLEREKQECIKRLKQENLFDLNKSIQMPLLPSNVAVISVSTSKGYSDFLGILKSKGERFNIRHELFPALLQGDKAVKSLSNALNEVKAISDQFDVLVILRGGGGDVGLDCYNSYELSRNVASFPIPILTGIGHSTNETVVELVANQNLITPTDLAYNLIGYFNNIEIRLLQANSFISLEVPELLQLEMDKLHTLGQRIQSSTRIILRAEQEYMEHLSKKAIRDWPKIIGKQLDTISKYAYNLLIAPSTSIQNLHLKLTQISRLLSTGSSRFLTNQGKLLEALTKNVSHLDPEKVLQRGYSITRHDGKTLTKADSVKNGQTIETQLAKGTIISKVE